LQFAVFLLSKHCDFEIYPQWRKWLQFTSVAHSILFYEHTTVISVCETPSQRKKAGCGGQHSESRKLRLIGSLSRLAWAKSKTLPSK
jgi:hypothetical protein